MDSRDKQVIADKVEILKILVSSLTGHSNTAALHEKLWKNIKTSLDSGLSGDSFMYLDGLMCAIYIRILDDKYLFSLINSTNSIRETKVGEFKELIDSGETSTIQQTHPFEIGKNYTGHDIEKIAYTIIEILCSGMEDYVMEIFSA